MRKIIYIFLIILAIIMSTVLYGCSLPDNGTDHDPTSKQAAAYDNSQTATDFIISETPVDIGNGFKDWKVVVKMKKGRYFEDRNPGPLSGWKWEGSFELVLANDRDEIVSQFDLNKAFGSENLVFNNKFNIQFEDYNADGFPEFTIGQYVSSGCYRYRMLTLDEAGKIVLTPFKGDGMIVCDGGGYSAKFEKTDKAAFKVTYYDNSAGKSFPLSYSWQEDKFVKSGGAETK